MIGGTQINIKTLPSKGKQYPEDIELFVKPMTAKEDMSTRFERLGNSDANYYQNLLNAVEIKGSFDKKKLLYGDIQFIDLIRRLYSFELEEGIEIENLVCNHCKKDIKPSFKFHEIEFEDFQDDVFEKEYSFSTDDLKVIASPITMDRFLRITRKFVSNAENAEDLTNYLFAYRAYSVIKVIDREFESLDAMHNFMFKYFTNLYKNKDIRILRQIDNDLTVIAKPVKHECENCGKELEVTLEPSMQFCQE